MNTRRTNIIAFAAAAFVLSVGALSVGSGTDFLKIQRGIETFSEVFRQISLNYVDDIDPQKIVEAGISGMLSELDPYSEYTRADEDDDFQMLTSGQYTGFGITVGRMDSSLVVTSVRVDQPAGRAGMRIGDRLITIDGVFVDTLSTKSLRTYTRGNVGTSADVRVVRDGRPDTITMRVVRSEVGVENVIHSELFDNGVGYIKLIRFSRRASDDVRKALLSLRSKGTMHSLVLDLRDNPGGLLDAAVGVSEIFLPKSSAIVSTRGRNGQESRSFSSRLDPQEPTLPLAVLINERSASASEIVAAAIQDNDRGVILGKRSFGKGLVQSVVTLPNESSLKLTTSRYYTPSGRSIQRISYRKDLGVKQDEADGLFLTLGGRPVLEHVGIEPDSTVLDSVYPSLIEHLVSNGVFFRYGTFFTANLDALPSNFAVDNRVLEGFLRFVDQQRAKNRSPILLYLSAARERAQQEQQTASTIKLIEAAETAANRDVVRVIRQHEPMVRDLLDQEIRARFDGEYLRISRSLRLDPVIRAASSVLTSRRYLSFLTNGVTNEQ